MPARIRRRKSVTSAENLPSQRDQNPNVKELRRRFSFLTPRHHDDTGLNCLWYIVPGVDNHLKIRVHNRGFVIHCTGFCSAHSPFGAFAALDSAARL